MLHWVLIHLPHLLPPVIAFAFLARLGVWAADQPPQHYSDEEVLEWRAMRDALHAERRRPVRRVVTTRQTTGPGRRALALGRVARFETVTPASYAPVRAADRLHGSPSSR